MNLTGPLLLSALLCGQVPQLTLPQEVPGKVGAFVVVTATTDRPEVGWYSPDEGLGVIPPNMLRDSRSAVVMASRAGRYRLVAWTATADGHLSVPVECSVVITEGPGPQPPPVPPGPSPQPQPEPQPGPPVPPNPEPQPQPPPPDGAAAKGAVDVVVVEETGMPQGWPAGGRANYLAAKEFQGVLYPTAVAKAQDPKSNRLILIDKDVKGVDPSDPTHKRMITPPNLVPYVNFAQGQKLPYYVMVRRADGKFYAKGTLPATPAELVALVHKYGG